MVLTSGGKPIPKSNGHSRLERRILIECRAEKDYNRERTASFWWNDLTNRNVLTTNARAL